MSSTPPTSTQSIWLRPISRRNLLRLGGAVTLGGFAGGSYMFGWGPHALQVSRTRIHLQPAAPPVAASQVIRAVHLSDLHASRPVSFAYLRHAVSKAIALKPDLFFLTGDFITGREGIDMAEYAEILRPLAQAAPCYASLGNHDGGSWAGSTYGDPTPDHVIQLLEEVGITLLYNDVQRVTLRDRTLILVGLGDFWNEDFLPLQAFQKLHQTEWVEGAERPPILLLSHNPDSKEDLLPYTWDLMLCGHTHGGQLVIPFLGTRPFLPVNDTRFAEGLYPWEGRQLYITRGVGNLHGARINCPPEISLLELA